MKTNLCNHASLGFIICSVCYVHISVCVIIRICGVCELVQFELRERQKRTHPDAAQRRRQNYVQHYMEQFLPAPEPVYVTQILSSLH